jgi:hypothetical protein
MNSNLLASLQPLVGHTITNIQLIPRKDYDGSNVDDDPQIVLILDNKHKAYFNASFGEYTGNSLDEYPIRNSITIEFDAEDLLDSRGVVKRTLLEEGFKEAKSRNNLPILSKVDVKYVQDEGGLHGTTYAFVEPEGKDDLWLFIELDKDFRAVPDGEWVFLNLQTSDEVRTFLKLISTNEKSNE